MLDEIIRRKNFLRLPHFRLFRDDSTKGKLDYPTHEIKVGDDTCLCYDIPADKMQEVLDTANPCKGDYFFPVEYRNYRYAMILYAYGHNYIVRPNFLETGETGWGWGMTKEELRRVKEIEKHNS